MHHYRQALMRMRQGESDRRIADDKLMGRPRAATLRRIAAEHGWLEPATALPDDATLAAVLESAKTARKRAAQSSSLEPHRELVVRWIAAGVDATAMHHKLVRDHGFSGHYSSVRRFVRQLAETVPRVTSVLDFAPGDTAQVDFGAGPVLLDGRTGEPAKTWVFVMTLAWSRHQYAELVTDQSIETWLGCHRRAFEHFGTVPARVLIDYVPRNIIDLMRRSPLCGLHDRDAALRRCANAGGNITIGHVWADFSFLKPERRLSCSNATSPSLPPLIASVPAG